ncbi:hypothetical protein RvY_04210 [Ramazzottius varieornatus]|uniref:Uncharacterized protein n=1 Tax=Ramazzottius varieornatus TaxID=947166 RepID=A0A1D1V0X6_RAMVA|nr:hypothetical protein RvY_04210 [Ramazzottius varieornatus]
MRISKDGEIPARSQINVPGKITYYKTTKGILSKEIVTRRTENFQQGGSFKLVGSSSFEPSTAFDAPAGSRGTLLGTNLFASYKGSTIASIENTSAPGTPKSRTNSDVGQTGNVTAKKSAAAGAEMAMLAKILGAIPDSKTSAEEKTTIDLDFLSLDLSSSSAPFVKSAASPTKVQRVELQNTKLKDFDLGLEASTMSEDVADDFDLLELMDQAAKSS